MISLVCHISDSSTHGRTRTEGLYHPDDSREEITKPWWNRHQQPSTAGRGCGAAVMRAISSKPARRRPMERKRKERLFVGSEDSSCGLSQSSLFHRLSVSHVRRTPAIGNGLIALRPVFRTASGPHGTLLMEYLAIINSVPLLPMDHMGS